MGLHRAELRAVEAVLETHICPFERTTAMLKDHDSSAILAVSDLGRARTFYEIKLGLEVAEEGDEEVVTYKTGATSLVIYQSEEAGHNRGNAVVWGVGDEIDAIAAELKSKGITFEHYDNMPGTQLEGDIHVAGEMRLVWFKDLDGNILHLNNM